MKTNFIYALMGAIALTGTMGFTSCSDSDVAETNPNFDPETNSVVVDLALNISTANTPKTRMSSVATQATENDAFRGISDARLFSFVQTANGKHLVPTDPTNIPIGKRYDLSQLVSPGQINSTQSRRVLEMSLPLKTNTLVFYGKATKGTSGENGYSVNETYGSFDTNELNGTTTDLSDITFSISRRLASDQEENFRKIEKLLSGILSCIMNTNLSGVTSAVTAETVVGGNEYRFNLTTDDMHNIEWSDYVNEEGVSPSSGNPLTPLETQLGQVYTQMTTIRGDNGELRAASGEALLQSITDLWSAINKVRCALPTSKDEAIAKKLAAEISEEISKYFKAESLPNDASAVSGVSFSDNYSTIVTNFTQDPFWPIDESVEANAAYVRANYGLSGLSTNLANFPATFKLPQGATHIKFNAEKKIFYYPEKFNTSGFGGTDFYVTDYLYPAELAYFGNSSIRVSNEPHKTSEYPNGANNTAPTATTVGGWNNEDSWTSDWNSNYVTAASRSVAMKYDINYGTALLKTSVKLGSTTLRDNNHAVQKSYNSSITDDKIGGTGDDANEYQNEPDKKITVGAGSFLLTGIIVGGQNRNAGWDFLPRTVKTGTETVGDVTNDVYGNQYGFIYDNAIPAGAKSVPETGYSDPNYTLVFDNYDASKAVNAQNSVFVALEFKNNTGQDFYGNYNLIRDQGTFYLIGLLDPTKTGLTPPTWPTWHALPPYNADGSSIEAVRVFMQDYMTNAQFVIGENSLKYAYLTVPDLRSSSLTLGLSVDIKWETGIDFGDVVLGGNDY